MAPNSAVLLHPSVPPAFNFLLDPVPQPLWGLERQLLGRAEQTARRLQTLAEIPTLPAEATENVTYLFKNVLADSAEIWSSPKKKKSKVIDPPKTLYLENGEWVYQCTRGCNLSFRNHVCFHGIPFTDRCTEACAECRIPHKETKFDLSTESQPSIEKGSCFTRQRGIPWKTRCVRVDAWTYKFWEKQLKQKPWSEELQRGRDQSMRHLRRIWNPTVTAPVDEPGTIQPFRDLEHELDDLGFGGSTMSIKQARIIPREVSEWMNDDTFVRGVIDRMFPHPHQDKKRHTLHWLVDAYYRRMEDTTTLCETLGLSQKGLDSKLSRFKEKGEKASASLLIS